MRCDTCDADLPDGRIHGLGISVSRRTYFSIIGRKSMPLTPEIESRLACYHDADAAREFERAAIESIKGIAKQSEG